MMKATWKAIGIISAILLGLAIVCVVVGMFTGGSTERLQEALNANYDVQYYLGLGKRFFGYLINLVK